MRDWGIYITGVVGNISFMVETQLVGGNMTFSRL
jgi:hypothetical protein